MISITNLDFAYKKKTNLFSNLNTHLAGGNIYGLLGKNGAGKTTLLKIMSGLLFPKQGKCRVLGFESIKRIPAMYAEIFFIPEELYVPRLTIREFEALYAPFYPRFGKSEYNAYLDEFSLSKKDKLTSLSYGQKKKFLLAFGLATGSRILILDEPTNGLDIPGKSQFRKHVATAVSDERIFIISTHQVRDMQQLIDPVIILERGSIVFERTVAEINERLYVETGRGEPIPNEALYSEKTIGGYSLLCAGDSGSSTDVDLEILFNAVIANSEKVNAAFGGETRL
jgi:ABC-2 type transport system ATP-binding protein